MKNKIKKHQINKGLPGRINWTPLKKCSNGKKPPEQSLPVMTEPPLQVGTNWLIQRRRLQNASTSAGYERRASSYNYSTYKRNLPVIMERQ